MPFLGITLQDVRNVFFVDDDKAQQRNSPENPSTSLSNPASWLYNLFAGPVASGVPVNQETTLGISAVWRAVRILSEGVASLEGSVIREDSEGNKTRLPNHKVARMLQEPGPLYTGFTFKESMTAFSTLKGNGMARILPNNKGFEIINPDTATAKYTNGMLVYSWQDENGNKKTADSSEIFHIPALVMDVGGVMGKNPIQVHRESLGLSIAQTKYGANFFKRGAHIDGYLSVDGELSSEKGMALARSWSQRFTGVDNVGKTPVLEHGMKYVPLSLNPQDAMFIEASRLSVEDVARIFGVPLHMLASLERATFSNIEHQSREFVTYALRPWVKRWEAEINRKLFTEDEKRNGYYYRFNLEGLLRGDSEAQARLIDTYMKWGITNRDEIRDMYGWNPSEDGTGKTHFVPVNMIPAPMAGQQQEIPFPEPETEENE